MRSAPAPGRALRVVRRRRPAEDRCQPGRRGQADPGQRPPAGMVAEQRRDDRPADRDTEPGAREIDGDRKRRPAAGCGTGGEHTSGDEHQCSGHPGCRAGQQQQRVAAGGRVGGERGRGEDHAEPEGGRFAQPPGQRACGQRTHQVPEAVRSGQRAGFGEAPAQLIAHGWNEQPVRKAGQPEGGGGSQRQPHRPQPAGRPAMLRQRGGRASGWRGHRPPTYRCIGGRVPAIDPERGAPPTRARPCLPPWWWVAGQMRSPAAQRGSPGAAPNRR